MTTNNAWNSPNLNANGKIIIGSTGVRPVAANITGDFFTTITNGSGSITVDSAPYLGSFRKISSATASGSASIVFTGLTSNYFLYIVAILNVAPANDGVTLIMRTSSNGGSSYASAASDYAYSNLRCRGGSLFDSHDEANTSIELFGPSGTTDELGNSTNEKLSAYLYIYNPTASKYTFITSEGLYLDEGADSIHMISGGIRVSAQTINAIQFLMDAGNISSGTFILYGVRNSA